MTDTRTRIVQCFPVLCCIVFTAAVVHAAEHPRLVSLASTKCTSCHADLLRGFDVIHPPVAEDCSSCHEVSITDEGTTVSLAEAEPTLCLMCHDQMEAAASGELEAPHAPVTDSCLNCHKPHASGEKNLLLAPRTELCTGCHDVEELQPKHGGQITAAVDCSTCHKPHGSANTAMLVAETRHAPFADGACDSCHREPFADRIRLRARGEKICTACHGEMNEEARENGSVHVALRGTRSRAGCLSCHDPHMSDETSLLTKHGNDLCHSCHNDVVAAAKADSGHPPAAEDCKNCHLPHASQQRHLLVEATPELCTMCHDAADQDLNSAHLGADLTGMECLSCHSPHGAGNPSLLARHIHAPILDGCEPCHEGAADKLMEDGESALCLACHDDIGEAAENAAVSHPAMEMIRCADCHNPHASKQERLVKEPGGRECTVCHEDQQATGDESTHGVIGLVGCRACHEPHGGNTPKMLRLEGAELCLSCHDRSRADLDDDALTATYFGRFELSAEVVRRAAVLQLKGGGEQGHPTPFHRALGTPTEDELANTTTSFTGELTCLSCHDPHKGRDRNLFVDGARGNELCARCHEKK